jgi:hypothetical protein
MESEPAGGKDGKQVRVATIDGLALSAYHLLKADVEGMEADVIRGATETIKAHCPALYVEKTAGENSRTLSNCYSVLTTASIGISRGYSTPTTSRAKPKTCSAR